MQTTEFTEQNNAIGVMRQDDFVPLTNFSFRFICKVTSCGAENVDHNGFIVEVKTQVGNGEEEKGCCFFAWHKTQQKGLNISKELGSAVPERSLISKLRPSQLMDVFWSKLMDFESDPNSSSYIKKPILTLGRQPSSSVIVLSPTLHVTEDGILIPSDVSEYVWVESIMKKEGVIPSGLIHSTRFPTYDNPLEQVLSGLQELTQKNFLSSVFVLGSVASSMFYEQLREKYGSFGVTIIVGEINRGKSKSVELSLASIGIRNARYSSISNARSVFIYQQCPPEKANVKGDAMVLRRS